MQQALPLGGHQIDLNRKKKFDQAFAVVLKYSVQKASFKGRSI